MRYVVVSRVVPGLPLVEDPCRTYIGAWLTALECRIAGCSDIEIRRTP